ncbi:hypothetical protein I3843_07G165300 [Carya illinoinensis]|uniref:Pentatricopeptide repeat-containing protein n=1 Tax=Carya illinoinensis TaxID=32201 RepID=A0A8T1PW35_CARIL|nr:hypothetical protein I3760_07G165300 [Carya illinoinensis]KAG6648759.1 hypothetical protein CIPAW_07G167700 [Carya illinoinensis]KAG6705240.1 hypothetical protein I3842_07G170400 [Carya illinoinensis]KAG7972074.1 hypothetical protein I3843_07G165300 [Carya illinoinensis]
MKTPTVFVKFVAVCFSRHRLFSTSPPSAPLSSLPWISPLRLSKATLTKPDPPTESITAMVESQRKHKYISHEFAINLIKRERDPQRALGIFNTVTEQKGFNHNSATYATILEKLARSKKFQAVDAVLRQMTYETCKFHEGKVDRARKMMEFMRKNGCNPNVFNYSTLMNGFCKEKKLLEAKEVFDEMKSFGLKPDTISYSTLINCFCRAGKVDEATELLEEMKEKECKADSVTFNVILGGLCREGRFETALDMLEKLPCDGVYLNKASYRIVLNFLCQKGELKKATELLYLMLGRGFLPHYATSNELLVRLCKAGMVDDAAVAMFELMEMGFKPEPDSWAHVLELICKERKLLSTFELLDELTVREL